MMENKLQLFQNDEFGNLEILMIDGKPYFPASECAEKLGYSKPANAVNRHCRYTLKRGIPHPQNPNKKIEVNFIPEGDLYRLIIRSKLQSAIRFEHWIVDDVLPSLRKYGAYLTEEALDRVINDPALSIQLFEALQNERGKNEVMQTQIAMLAPKARYYDVILQSKDATPISFIAKDYGMSAVSFNQFLHMMKIQYKIRDTWLLYQDYAGCGYTVSRTYIVSDRKSVVQTYWTQKGRAFLYETLKSVEIIPLCERS